MSQIDLIEAGKTALSEAKIAIVMDCGDVTCDWINAKGETIAHGLGYPALCSNSPAREKCRCVHLSVYWKKVFGDASYYDCNMEHYEAAEVLEAWLNQQPVTAAECVSAGGTHVTRGTWHARKNRWMWGPKIERRKFSA